MKRKLLFLTALMLATLGLKAQTHDPINIDLWPNGLPNTNGIDNLPEDLSKQNFKASIRVFLPEAEKATGRAVVVCPGGGYTHLALDHEGYDWAPFFNNQGIALIVLKYRMPRGNREVPMSDAFEAIRQVRTHATEWHINPQQVGIMGSSAGGHLASTVATHAKPEVRPNFQILFYPVISMDPALTHGGSHDGFLGKSPAKGLEDEFSNEKQVRAGETPPAIMLLSDDDNVVNPMNSVLYYSALKKAGIAASLHIYPVNGHGWGFRPNFFSHNAMLQDLTDWLKCLK
jgi:acetyl esterase/lipase